MRAIFCAALGNEAAAKGMSYMTQDKEEREFPYWTIIAENAGGLSLSFAPLAALPMPPHPAPACKDPTLVCVGSCAQARVRRLMRVRSTAALARPHAASSS